MVGDHVNVPSFALGGDPLDGPGPAGGAALSIEAQARLVGGYQWVERRLFEVLGAWAASESLAEAQVLFDVYGLQHAWHAELFAERLPALDSIDPDTLTVPPSAAVDRVLGVLAGTAPLPVDSPEGGVPAASLHAGGTLIRLIGLGRVVLPRLVAGYGLHLRRLSPVAEAPVGRCLRLVLRDEVEQWQAVEAFTQSLLRRPNDITVVTEHQRRLEQLVAESGAGLVPWPRIGPQTGSPPDDAVPASPGAIPPGQGGPEVLTPPVD